MPLTIPECIRHRVYCVPRTWDTEVAKRSSALGPVVVTMTKETGDSPVGWQVGIAPFSLCVVDPWPSRSSLLPSGRPEVSVERELMQRPASSPRSLRCFVTSLHAPPLSVESQIPALELKVSTDGACGGHPAGQHRTTKHGGCGSGFSVDGGLTRVKRWTGVEKPVADG